MKLISYRKPHHIREACLLIRDYRLHENVRNTDMVSAIQTYVESTLSKQNRLHGFVHQISRVVIAWETKDWDMFHIPVGCAVVSRYISTKKNPCDASLRYLDVFVNTHHRRNGIGTAMVKRISGTSHLTVTDGLDAKQSQKFYAEMRLCGYLNQRDK